MPPDILDYRRPEAELLFRRIGITFAVYGEADAQERLIPFDMLPRILSAGEWDALRRGALKMGLISMDSTMRSNLGVGMPIDILVARRDVCDAEVSYRIEPGVPYFHDLRECWSAALRAAHMAIPRPPYGPDAEITIYASAGGGSDD